MTEATAFSKAKPSETRMVTFSPDGPSFRAYFINNLRPLEAAIFLHEQREIL